MRFSYPPDAPVSSVVDPDSTGITPFVARTSLLDSATPQNVPALAARQLLRHQPRRRRSAPVAPTPMSAWSEDSLQLSSRPIEIQFTPLRQLLSERTRRRLTRRRMSETMNDIDDEKKLQRQQERELVEVKREVEQLRGSNVLSVVQSERIHELEEEIVRLKEQIEQSEQIHRSTSEAIDAGSSVEEVMLLDSRCESPADSMPITPTRSDSCSSAKVSVLETPCASAAVQTELPAEAIDKLHAHFNSQVHVLSHARLELERILPGETPLPLSSPTEHISLWDVVASRKAVHSEDSSADIALADAEPLLSAVLGHIRAMQTRITRTTQDLSTSEEQRINVVSNFRAALRQLDEARQARAALIAQSQIRQDPSHGSSPLSERTRERRRITEEDVRACELEEATEQLKELQKNTAMYERDRASLVAALDKYRAEVKDMERLIGTLEAEHILAIQDLKEQSSRKLENLVKEHAQAVDDLEARVAAETRGRREAEAEIDKIAERWAEQRTKGEREVGSLNVRLAGHDEEVRRRGQEVGRLRKELAELQEHVRDFVGTVGGGLNSPVEEPCLPMDGPADKIHRFQPPGRVGKWGLLTPHVEGGRFKDVSCELSPDLSSDASVGGDMIPGEVELERGKCRNKTRRHDSGIGIVMEVEDEE